MWVSDAAARDGRGRHASAFLTGHKIESVYRRAAIVSERDACEAVRRLAPWRTGYAHGHSGGEWRR